MAWACRLLLPQQACATLQVLALEALQLYAPMGHSLGLGRVSSSIEDICFQVWISAGNADVLHTAMRLALTTKSSVAWICHAAAASSVFSCETVALPADPLPSILFRDSSLAAQGGHQQRGHAAAVHQPAAGGAQRQRAPADTHGRGGGECQFVLLLPSLCSDSSCRSSCTSWERSWIPLQDKSRFATLKLLHCLQLHGRTKSLFSSMRKILRLGDMAAGGRRLEMLNDLLGLRAIVQSRSDLLADEARLAAIEVCLSAALAADPVDLNASVPCGLWPSSHSLVTCHDVEKMRQRQSSSFPDKRLQTCGFFGSRQACYTVNDAVRDLWPEVEGRSKDYILTPKGNNYQSLHTTVEVQTVDVVAKRSA